jgi:hypothetical protein
MSFREEAKLIVALYGSAQARFTLCSRGFESSPRGRFWRSSIGREDSPLEKERKEKVALIEAYELSQPVGFAEEGKS